jgi:phage protein D
MRPSFKVLMGRLDITAKISDRLISLIVNDVAGVKSDTVQIVLDDRDNRIAEPPDGTLITVFMGYEGMPLLPMGVFVLDKVEYSIAPDKMTIHGKAANFGGSLKDQKTRNWDKKTVKEIVETIAKEHGLEPKVAKRFQHIKFEYLAQRAESDINLLSRVGAKLDAIVSVKQGALLFIGKGEGQSASGQSLPQTWVYKNQMLAGSRCSKNKASIYKSIKATWHDKKSGNKHTLIEGEGAPAFEITQQHTSEEAAKRAARAKLDEQARQGHSLSLNLLGNPVLRAEGQLVAVGLRTGIPTLWSIKSVSHRLGGNGYTTQIEGELPRGGKVDPVVAKPKPKSKPKTQVGR